MTAILTDDQKTAMTQFNSAGLGQNRHGHHFANGAAFLASEEAKYITGHTLDVDGGIACMG